MQMFSVNYFHFGLSCSDQQDGTNTHSHLSKTVHNITHSWHSVDTFMNYLSPRTQHQDLTVN